MKKLYKFGLIFVLLIFLSGCDGEEVRCAHLNNKTQGQSTNYAISFSLDKDDRMKEKYVDLQIKSSCEGQVISFGREMEEKTSLYLEDKDVWYNLTVLIAEQNGLSGYETFEKYVDKKNETYLFTVENDTTLTFRVVAGNITENDEKTGQILTSVEAISNELKVEAKKSEK